MLAKLWKKVLLAICIIACIFNIMSKLVNRHSLKENLESVNDGKTIFSIFQKEVVVETESEPIIEGVMNSEQSDGSSEENANTTIVVEKTNEVESVEQETMNQNVTEENISETNTSEGSEERTNKTFKFSDFTILFK